MSKFTCEYYWSVIASGNNNESGRIITVNQVFKLINMQIKVNFLKAVSLIF